jgi:segregation and condensation protein B
MTEEPLFPLHRIVEAILFASQKPVSSKELSSIFKGAAEAAKENPAIACFEKIKHDQFEEAIRQLEQEYAETGRSFEVRESAAGWQLVTKADFAPWLRQLFPENRQARLSAPAMETLAIIAYRQPITRADLEAVRGVAVDGVMQTLLDRGLVRIAGRSEIPGRPLLYETTQFFMEHFGLKNLDDLPNASELRRIPLPKAEVPAAPEVAKESETSPEAKTSTPQVVEAPESEETPSEQPAEESMKSEELDNKDL